MLDQAGTAPRPVIRARRVDPPRPAVPAREASDAPHGLDVPGCPRARGQTPIGVTPPEALAAAERLRLGSRPEELSAVRRRLVEATERCAQWRPSAAMSADDFLGAVDQPAPVFCAFCNGGPAACPLDDDRPLECLGALDQRAELRERLAEAGLDMHVYEMNAAVLRALNMRDAARRWREGDRIFRGCRRLAVELVFAAGG